MSEVADDVETYHAEMHRPHIYRRDSAHRHLAVHYFDDDDGCAGDCDDVDALANHRRDRVSIA